MPIKDKIIDSNLLIDYYTLPKNSVKRHKLKSLINKGVAINDVTIGEVTNYLKNKVNHFTAFIAMNAMLYYPNFHILPIEAQIRREAMQIAKKYKDLKLAYNDCLLLAQSNIYALPILTDDEAMWSVEEASFSYLS